MKQFLSKHLFTVLAVAILAFLLFFLWPSAKSSGPLKEGKTTLQVGFDLPENFKFIKDAPFELEWFTNNRDVIQFEEAKAKNFDPASWFPYKIKLLTRPGQATIQLKAVLYYCDKSSGTCFQNTHTAAVPIEVASSSGSSSLLYTWNVPAQNPEDATSPQAVAFKR